MKNGEKTKFLSDKVQLLGVTSYCMTFFYNQIVFMLKNKYTIGMTYRDGQGEQNDFLC